MRQFALWLRRRGPILALEVFANIVLPTAIYDRLAPGHGDVMALLGSSVPPLLWSLGSFVVRRRVDALALLSLTGIILSVLALAGGGSARLLQLRENLVTGLVGLIFLGSIAIGRPLIYYLAVAGAARGSAEKAAAFAAKRDLPRFRRVMRIMTLTWGFGLLASTALACLLVFTLSIHTYLLVAPIVGNGIMGSLGLWTFWYARRARRHAAALEAAAVATDGRSASSQQPGQRRIQGGEEA